MVEAVEYLALLPVFVLVAFATLVPIVGAFRARGGVLSALALLGVLIAGALTAATVYDIPGLGFMPDVTPVVDEATGELVERDVVSFALLELTPFVVLFELVFLLIALIVILGSPRYITGRHQGEYYGLVLFATTGMMLVAASRELITLFVSLELASFSTYVLAGYFKKRLSSSEAAVKYFLVGSISSSLALFGISIVYGLTGSTTFEALANLWTVPVTGGATIGGLLLDGRFTLGVFVWALLLAGFGYKIAAVPFHNYAPDVYEGAPSTVGALLSTGSKHMGFAAIFKIFFVGLFAIKANWDVMVGIIAIVTMIVGNVAALQQTNIKRMLAYSSIAQAGYILIALAVGTDFALTGGLFHILTYAIMGTGAFVAVAAAGAWGVGDELSDWKGMSKRAPFLAFGMVVFMLSFAGIPPLAGFASKFVLFSSAVDAGGWYLWLAVVGILTSAISLVYYWRVIRVMYVEETEGRRLAVASAATMSVFLGVLGTVLFGLFPSEAVELSAAAAESLFASVAAIGP